MKKSYYLWLVLIFFNMTMVLAQEKTVTGTVTDDAGLPLPGANVIIKQTNTGTQSDFDGNYTISAAVGQTLSFSYVGFETQELKVGASNTMSVSLRPGALLEEVVVTGYSTRNKTVQTSAVVSISASEISQLAPTTSVDNLLQGKAAGVQVTAANGKPGQGAFVRIRGTGSLSAGGSSPLYLVDGAPIREEELGNIATSDIENITILKDAATTARYGSRGSNGVVVITTKTGNRNKDATVRYSSRFGTTTRVDLNYTMMDATQKLQYERDMYALGVAGAAALPGVTTQPGSPERDRLTRNALDWEELVLKDGYVQNNNISIDGGAEKMDYFFSVGHDKNTGIIDKISGFERLNSRLNVNFDAKEWLSVGVNVGYARSLSDEPRDRNNSQNPFRHMLDVNPYETEFVLDEFDQITYNENGEPIYNTTTTGYPVRRALETEPAFEVENITLANVDALVKFSKSLSYGFSFAVNHLNRRRETYSKPGGVLDDLIGNADFPGRKTDANTQRLDMTASNRLNYTLITENHNLNILGLFEYNFNEVNTLSAISRGFSSPLLTTQSNAGFTDSASTTRNRLTLVSYGAFADYDFNQRYLASASIRRDGSSNFGSDVQYGTFYSGSIGWNVAKENFFKVDAIDDLKIRAAIGTVGNRSGIDRYEAQGFVGFAQYPGGLATEPSNFPNPELQWETTQTTNVGIELNMFNRRISFVGDYFVRNTTELLFDIPRSDESGVDTVAGNAAEIENGGIELSLQADIVRSPDVTWTIGGNILLLTKSEIVSLPNGAPIDPPNTFNIRWDEGTKINEHFLIRYAGLDSNTGRPMYYGADGNTYFADEMPEDDNQNRVFQGKSTIADKEGGFFNNIVYKGFGLRTDFVFKYGNWINNFVKSNVVSDGLAVDANQATEAFNYWQQPGDTDVSMSPIYRNDEGSLAANTDRFLERGDYIRMRNVTLSYSFPKKTLEKSPLSNLRVYVQGQNLLTFTKFFGDPEVGLSSGETISFADSVAPGEATLYSYPNTKSIQVGLDVSF
ncbi:SusC/RagA family TonB-linked outer membrane protein [Ulvibacter antarcticus]|uniref:TonB-linked SusC/RagA family outer membrane protein n=1 Tax=Ulvibacter antarcticus TaxID=442714 RepID=A0A3L9YID5_9FLAO|nr:SusC/RagA family TonB-linked outer membrane protein [Ulvibacter antarcticus]RMA57915.1 TonB-linked SusC/RagA family outer membrane protein [Ulvibacter antarcticus]